MRLDTFDKFKVSFQRAGATLTILVVAFAFVIARAGASTVRRAEASTEIRFSSVSAAAQGAASLVYMADQSNGAVLVYNNVANSKPVRAITKGIYDPVGITIDSSGNLYVANFALNNVVVYAPGGSAPIRTYSQGLSGPVDVKVSLSGEVYVANYTGGTIVVYPPGSTLPANSWQSPFPYATNFWGRALQSPDAAQGGDVYVTYAGGGVSPTGGGVLWCPIGSSFCFDTGIYTSPFVTSIAFQYGTFPLTLLAADNLNSVIDVFHLRHGKTPAAQFTVSRVQSIAFDRAFTHLFATSETFPPLTPHVNEYNYPSGTLDKTFLFGPSARVPVVTGIAVYPAATYELQDFLVPSGPQPRRRGHRLSIYGSCGAVG